MKALLVLACALLLCSAAAFDDLFSRSRKPVHNPGADIVPMRSKATARVKSSSSSRSSTSNTGSGSTTKPVTNTVENILGSNTVDVVHNKAMRGMDGSAMRDPVISRDDQARPSFAVPNSAGVSRVGPATIQSFSESAVPEESDFVSTDGNGQGGGSSTMFSGVDYGQSIRYDISLSSQTLSWSARQDHGPSENVADINLSLLETSTVFGRGPAWTRITPITSFPHRVIGKVAVGCTGALIRHRIVLTAAHCIYSHRRGNVWNSLSQLGFTPAHDRGATNTVLAAQTAFVPTAFVNSASYGSENDWGVIILRSATRIGYMGTSSGRPSSATLDGYPGRQGGGQEMWEDTQCQLTHHSGTRRHSHHCDVQPGSSGGPMYTSDNRIHAVQASETSTANYAPVLTVPDINAIKAFIRTYG